MLKKTCNSCDKDRKKSKLVYDVLLNPYCKAPHECNADHPNSTINLIRNGKITILHDHDRAVELFTESNKSETVKHMENPITIRLGDVRQAIHIEKVCEDRKISISNYIRALIEADMQTVVVEEKEKPIVLEEEDNETELTF